MIHNPGAIEHLDSRVGLARNWNQRSPLEGHLDALIRQFQGYWVDIATNGQFYREDIMPSHFRGGLDRATWPHLDLIDDVAGQTFQDLLDLPLNAGECM